jgi:putative PEP-CTERM system histidine kinase
MISIGLLTLGIARSRFKELVINPYVSQQALAGSVTFIIVGLYLLTVGVIGEWLRRMNQPFGSELSVVVVFVALVALAVLGLSKTARVEIRRFLVRNFHRPKYDYRAEWLRVTESFQLATTKETILDSMLNLLVKTFSTTTISIWVFREADQRYCQARPADPKMPAMEPAHLVIRQLADNDEGVMMRELRDWPSDALEPFVRTGAELCFPIRVQGQLAAFVLLGKQPHGDSYGIDDCDLLRGICHHAGALLSNARFAEERQASAELEALHRFSLFCLHDLKNLAARLSLVAQNAVQHGRDPAFQESAMRTVTDTADKMTSLMSKLSLKSVKPGPTEGSEAVDMAKLLDEVVAPLKLDETVRLGISSGPVKPVMAVREHLHQLLLNIILNARQAISGKGEISVVLSQVDSSVVIIVQDTGCGIPPVKLESLFRPSQSSRPGGLGIGLYQCKQIVEACGGTIQIQSEEGNGTQVTITLPVAPIADHETVHANG